MDSPGSLEQWAAGSSQGALSDYSKRQLYIRRFWSGREDYWRLPTRHLTADLQESSPGAADLLWEQAGLHAVLAHPDLKHCCRNL